MQTDLDSLYAAMEARKSAMLATLTAMPPEQATRRPAGGGWSAADLVNHMLLVEVFALQQFRERRHARIRRSLLDRLRFAFVRAVLRSRMRVKVPVAAVDPDPEPPDVAEIASRWALVRDDIRELVDGLAPDELDYCYFQHPYAGHFTCADGFAFILLHWDHHEPQWQALLDS